jgi:integrase
MRSNPPITARTQSLQGSLPAFAQTRGGVLFDPSAECWTYRDGVMTVRLDFRNFSSLSRDMKVSLKRTLLWYAENRSAGSLVNTRKQFLHFTRHIGSKGKRVIDKITESDILDYKASLSSGEWYLSSLSGLLRKWHQLGIPGIADSVFGLLNELRIKDNPHGVPVLTMDSIIGPLTQIEQEAIQAALHDAFEVGNVDEDMYLLAWLLMALGQRPVQYAALKVCDVLRSISEDGQVRHTVKMPRAKQRNRDLRQLFKERHLVPQIGAPLYAYAQRVRASFSGKLQDPDQAPLFPAMSQINRIKSPPGYEHHDTAKGLSARLSAVLNALEVPSERTEGPIHITPVRFRRTLGTRAAQEGYGELIIAELLDHEDTQHVGVYVGSVPEIAARIDRAVAMKLAPLAQAFAGRLITNESEATRTGDPRSRILDLRIDQTTPMGSCGQHSFCHFNAPVACYTCRSFEPWLDGPHEEILARLIAERERLSATTDQRIASINDRTILAVAEVVRLCQQAKGSAGTGHG